MTATTHAPPFHSPPPSPDTTGEPTGATRHLCTGVHVDEEFRDLVIGEICTTPYRRIAPSYGFDLVPVMRHAWLALHLTSLLRSALAAAALAPHLLGYTVTSLLVIGGFTLLVLLERAWALSKRLTRPEEPLPGRRSKKKPKRLPRLPSAYDWKYGEDGQHLKRTGAYCLLLAAALAAVAYFHPEQGTLALYIGCAVAALAVVTGGLRQWWINGIQKAPSLRPRRLSHREQVVDDQQKHPCVVYRRPAHRKDTKDEEQGLFTLFGEESPFIGAGTLIHQWNPPMNVQLLRPGSEGSPLHEREHRYPPFKPHELVDHLREAVAQLREDDESVRLPVEVRDRVYVAQSDISKDRSLLREEVSTSVMRRIIDRRDPAYHYFLEAIVPDAGGELVATVLLQIGVRGRTLSLSFAACVLTRTPDDFRKAGEFGQHGKRAVISAARRGLFRLPREIRSLGRVVYYPYFLARALVFHKRDLTLKPMRNVGIGSRISIRQEHAEEWSKVQLDKTHVLGHMKNVEQRLLKATSDFLRSRGVDVSDFDNRALQIINSGIVNMGGTNDFRNTAVGDHAQFHHNPNGSTAPGGAQNGSAT
ncbi:hypothetical protein SUDANB121_05455 [Nocardiopsis dassonvillei]|uniref:hypothetical protein n=1 Tax=Nocardiopsis dassonvillei TaxID=2014 RepID=UPI003F54719F